MSTLNPTDLLLVEREGVQYKMQAGDMDLGPTGVLEAPVEVLTPLNGAGLGPGVPYNPISSPITAVDGNNITCSDGTELANMVGPISMTDENGDLVTPQTSEITSASGTAPAITLTFADSTDLEYFQPGDVVQSDWDQRYVWSDYLVDPGTEDVENPERAFNGDLTNAASSGAYPSGTESMLTFTLPDGLVFDGKIEANLSQGGSPTYFAIRTDKGDYPVSVTSARTWYDISAAFNLGSSNYFTVVHDNVSLHGTGLAGVRIDGLLLVDEGVEDTAGVKVISTDLVNNTMVVDGGNWGAYNDSQVWSAALTSTGGWLGAGTPDKAFDGDTDSFADSDSSGWVLDLSAHTFGTGEHTIELRSGGASAGGITVNNSTALISNGGAGAAIWTGTHTGELIGIESEAGSISLYYLKIDGKLLVDTGVSGLNNSVSLPTLQASATDVVGVDGNTLQLDGVSGPWRPSLHIKGASISSAAPSPDSIVFTSSNGGTTAVTGTDATLSSRVWTLEKSSSQTGPWAVVGEYTDLDANASQDGATPWTTTKPALEANTYYQVKVRYTSSNASSIQSIYSTFKTGDA